MDGGMSAKLIADTERLYMDGYIIIDLFDYGY